uniref:Uracil-DNA glycosylase n=1 Tax=Lygus hesperus TaxID=30085 RepID=A0A0A9X4M1_LYGHE
MSFSVQRGVPIPSSLRNIYKELRNDITDFVPPSHGCLLEWAHQGVLLLNTVLTVRKNQPNSHKNIGWAHFTDAVLRVLASRNQPIVWMLWGAYAQSKLQRLSIPDNHLVLRTVHPSGLSANRGFFHSSHFSKCNAF